MSYPKSNDKKIKKISNLLVKYAEQSNINFTFSGKDLYPVETFSHFGFLSLFLLETKDLYEKVFNKSYTIEELLEGVNQKVPDLDEKMKLKDLEYVSKQPKEFVFPIDFVEQEEGTYLGFVPKTSKDVDYVDFAPLAFCTIHTVENYINKYAPKNRNKNETLDVPLDILFDKMSQKINNNQVKIKPEQKRSQQNF